MKSIKIFIKIQSIFKMKKQRKIFLQKKRGAKLFDKLFIKYLRKSILKQWNGKAQEMIKEQNKREKE